MTLAELRKLSIRKQFQIRFRLRNGMECVITEHGIAKVPELKHVPDFNLETELASAMEFFVEPAPSANLKLPVKKLERPRPVPRAELAEMLNSSPASAAAPSHEDE